jgi:hypothetical protein
MDMTLFTLHYARAHAPRKPPYKTKTVYFTNVSVTTLNFQNHIFKDVTVFQFTFVTVKLLTSGHN